MQLGQAVIPCTWPMLESVLSIVDIVMQLGQEVEKLQGQLGLMEQQCRSLSQEKEQLEEDLHHNQAALQQAASDAQHAQAMAAQAAHEK